jgi:hypothetical protein
MRFSGGSSYLNRVEFAAEVGLGYMVIFTQVVAVAVHIHSVVLTKSEQRQPRQLVAKRRLLNYVHAVMHPAPASVGTGHVLVLLLLLLADKNI